MATVPGNVRLSRHVADLDDDGHDSGTSLSIVDAGGYYIATDIEGALQEIAAKDIGVSAHGNLGSTETFSALFGTHTGTLDANCTFTLSGATSGLSTAMALWLTQDGTGGRTITLPSSVTNKTALQAAQVTTASLTTILVLWTLDGGTSWVGGWWGGGSSVAALDDLTDVTITSATTGDRLRYNGSAWVNSALKWVPVMASDGTNYYVVVDGSGNAVMAEA